MVRNPEVRRRTMKGKQETVRPKSRKVPSLVYGGGDSSEGLREADEGVSTKVSLKQTITILS